MPNITPTFYLKSISNIKVFDGQIICRIILIVKLFSYLNKLIGLNYKYFYYFT